MMITLNEKKEGDAKISREFTLTPFDFLLTDNTLLADGNRFAIVLDKITPIPVEIKTTPDLEPCKNPLDAVIAYLRLIWFPENYFTPRERPINYNELREKLGIITNNKK